ncbi:MAG: hypothetical protein ABI726_00015 [bacterium]
MAPESDSGNRIVEIEEALLRPGTYFNPQTEVVVVVDDSASIDQEVFNMEPYEGAEWVRISDDVPIDEEARDTALQAFQTHYHPGSLGSISETALEQGDDEYDADEEGQDPGRED